MSLIKRIKTSDKKDQNTVARCETCNKVLAIPKFRICVDCNRASANPKTVQKEATDAAELAAKRYNERMQEARAKEAESKAAAAAIAAHAARWTPRDCSHCGKPFVPPFGFGDEKVCAACNKLRRCQWICKDKTKCGDFIEHRTQSFCDEHMEQQAYKQAIALQPTCITQGCKGKVSPNAPRGSVLCSKCFKANDIDDDDEYFWWP